MANQSISLLRKLPNNMHNWGNMVHHLLGQTEGADMGKGTGEVQELSCMVISGKFSVLSILP
jgi:hypothetical protein